ncbi:hypothetical protein EDB86DRAFT_2900154, partial [Lactarius hatsudake]
MEPMLRCLPRLPILVDYSAESWTDVEDNLALAALGHHSCVRRITLRRPYMDMAKLFKALSYPFPQLESFEICPIYDPDYERELILPAELLSGSAPTLRRLKLQGVVPECLSPLLASSSGLVELSLTINTVYSSPPEASLPRNLQSMSCPRRLELDLNYRPDTMYFDIDPPPPASVRDVVLLSKLTHLIFTGHRLYLQALVVGLAAPSLQHLDATLYGSSRDFPIASLSAIQNVNLLRFAWIFRVRSSSFTQTRRDPNPLMSNLL